MRVNWPIVGSAITAIFAVMALFGFSSPSSAVMEIKAKVNVIEDRIDKHDVQFAEMQKDLKYISYGIDELRGKKR